MAASDNRDNIIDYAGDFRLKACTIISYRKSPTSEKEQDKTFYHKC